VNVLVTGGAGFIGSHVAERLLRDGDRVTILDDFSDGYAPVLKRQNVAEVRRAGAAALVRCDVRDAGALARAVAKAAPDAIVHLAARTGVRASVERPLLYEDVNVRGTFAVLEAMRAARVPRLVFASSSSVYGNAGERGPVRESEPLVAPLSPYAATKIAGESAVHVYAHLYGIAAVCLRFFTVYGPRQRPDLAIHAFAGAILRGEPIPVYGDGGSRRDYTYAADAAEAVAAALRADARFEVVNVGSARPVRLGAMIAALERALGRPARVRHLPPQPGDVEATFAEIGKARALLGWEPRTAFEDGIAAFARWYLAARASVQQLDPEAVAASELEAEPDLERDARAAREG
jgi:UDP-glucuronate 4-epimerase